MAQLVGVFQTAHTPFCYRRPEDWDKARRGRVLRADVLLDDEYGHARLGDRANHREHLVHDDRRQARRRLAGDAFAAISAVASGSGRAAGMTRPCILLAASIAVERPSMSITNPVSPRCLGRFGSVRQITSPMSE